MSPGDRKGLRGGEVIAPIPVRSAAAAERAGGGPRTRHLRVGAVLLLITALTAGGLWWIDRLARIPVTSASGEPQGPAPPAHETAPSAAAPVAAAPRMPAAAPEPAAAQPPAAAADTGSAAPLAERLAAGERLSAAGELAAALSEFQEALRLDPQSQPAHAGLDRVKARIRAEEFRRWMAEGFAALNAGDPDQANARFLKAKALRPESPEAAEALAQAEGLRRTARIEALQTQALAADRREEWAAALSAYEEALALEPTLRFAQQGRERAAALLAWERRIAFYTAQPAVLDSDARLGDAVGLLQELQSAAPESARLRTAADQLAALVRTAQTPLRVLIESDQLTEVSVYRVGRLGRFASRQLNLRPGIYTVVGSRDGYRDERLELVVRPGPEPIRVSIHCKAKIELK